MKEVQFVCHLAGPVHKINTLLQTFQTIFFTPNRLMFYLMIGKALDGTLLKRNWIGSAANFSWKLRQVLPQCASDSCLRKKNNFAAEHNSPN